MVSAFSRGLAALPRGPRPRPLSQPAPRCPSVARELSLHFRPCVVAPARSHSLTDTTLPTCPGLRVQGRRGTAEVTGHSETQSSHSGLVQGPLGLSLVRGSRSPADDSWVQAPSWSPSHQSLRPGMSVDNGTRGHFWESISWGSEHGCFWCSQVLGSPWFGFVGSGHSL